MLRGHDSALECSATTHASHKVYSAARSVSTHLRDSGLPKLQFSRTPLLVLMLCPGNNPARLHSSAAAATSPQLPAQRLELRTHLRCAPLFPRQTGANDCRRAGAGRQLLASGCNGGGSGRGRNGGGAKCVGVVRRGGGAGAAVGGGVLLSSRGGASVPDLGHPRGSGCSLAPDIASPRR